MSKRNTTDNHDMITAAFIFLPNLPPHIRPLRCSVTDSLSGHGSCWVTIQKEVCDIFSANHAFLTLTKILTIIISTADIVCIVYDKLKVFLNKSARKE